MLIHVEIYTFGPDEEAPSRLHLYGRNIGIAENIDRWDGSNYRYFKVRGDDGNLYILRHDEIRSEWELTMFQSARGETAAMQTQMAKPQKYLM